MEYLAKTSFSFLQDYAFTSSDEGYTNKWNILQKSRFLFCKFADLLAMMKDILINGISGKKFVFLFVRLRIY